MIQLSQNFTDDEFKCRCGCGTGTMENQFIEKLQKMRDLLAKPMEIVRGASCIAHNKSIGGEPDSQHLPNAQGKSNAADLKIENGNEIYAYVLAAMTAGMHGIGIKNKADDPVKKLHVDDRPGPTTIWTY